MSSTREPDQALVADAKDLVNCAALDSLGEDYSQADIDRLESFPERLQHRLETNEAAPVVGAESVLMRLPLGAYERVRRLNRTGLFGFTLGETAERLLCEALERRSREAR